MVKREAFDLSAIDGKFGLVVLQADLPKGTAMKTIEAGTINAEENVVQNVLWVDEKLGGPYNVRVVEFHEISLDH